MQDTFNKIKPNCKILALMSDSRSIWGALAGFAKMTCCIWLFAAECLGSTAAILSRWDLESGGLFCVENRFFVWRDGIDAIPAIRFDCPLSQRKSYWPWLRSNLDRCRRTFYWKRSLLDSLPDLSVICVLAMPSKKTDYTVSLKTLSNRKAKERRETASAIRSGKVTPHGKQLRNAPYSDSKVRVAKLFDA